MTKNRGRNCQKIWIHIRHTLTYEGTKKKKEKSVNTFDDAEFISEAKLVTGNYIFFSALSLLVVCKFF